MKLLSQLCDGDRVREEAALEAAQASLQAREALWDQTLYALQTNRLM